MSETDEWEPEKDFVEKPKRESMCVVVVSSISDGLLLRFPASEAASEVGFERSWTVLYPILALMAPLTLLSPYVAFSSSASALYYVLFVSNGRHCFHSGCMLTSRYRGNGTSFPKCQSRGDRNRICENTTHPQASNGRAAVRAQSRFLYEKSYRRFSRAGR